MEEEKNFPPDTPGHSTGPRSPEGKSASSMNRLTHGCRSEKTVLPFEDPAEFEFTIQSWNTSYDPQDPTAATLVYETAKAHWFFQRNQKRLDQIETRLPSDAWLWTEENIKLFNNFLRYRTTAERGFYRAFNNLEAHYKRQADRAAQAEKARAQMARIELEWVKKKEDFCAEPLLVTQCIEIVRANGETLTNPIPPNETILASVAKLKNPPEFVNRLLMFQNGVPPEYEWTCPNPLQRAQPTLGVQRLTYKSWLALIDQEQAAGHILPRETSLFKWRKAQ